MFLQKTRVLSGNALKILAAACMLCDHVAYMLVPSTSPLQLPLRAVGRLALPLFAYMLAEGCRYTRDKFRHFALLFCVAVGCQIVYYLFDNGNLDMSVLVTFTLSESLIFALQKFKKDLFFRGRKRSIKFFRVRRSLRAWYASFSFAATFRWTTDFSAVFCPYSSPCPIFAV